MNDKKDKQTKTVKKDITLEQLEQLLSALQFKKDTAHIRK